MGARGDGGISSPALPINSLAAALIPTSSGHQAGRCCTGRGRGTSQLSCAFIRGSSSLVPLGEALCSDAPALPQGQG